MGYLDIKPAPAPASKSLSANATALQNGAGLGVSQSEQMGGRTVSVGNLHSDSGNLGRDPRRTDGNIERIENNLLKYEPSHLELKVGSINGSDQSSLLSTDVQSQLTI